MNHVIIVAFRCALYAADDNCSAATRTYASELLSRLPKFALSNLLCHYVVGRLRLPNVSVH